LLNGTSTDASYMSFAVSGASTQGASDSLSVETLAGSSNVGATFLVNGLTPGLNTFTANYRVNGGTGTFTNRRITVWTG
jgi:putative ribosome biogenesis GTPase RsgA